MPLPHGELHCFSALHAAPEIPGSHVQLPETLSQRPAPLHGTSLFAPRTVRLPTGHATNAEPQSAP